MLSNATSINYNGPYYCVLAGFSAPKPQSCMAGLGLENGNIPDSAIIASSFYNSYYRPDQGRLQAQYESGGYGSWLAATSNNQQWFQVDFGNWTKVTRVAIQGRLNAAQWVTKFKLAYGYDGVFFKDYKEDGDTAKVKDTPLGYTMQKRMVLTPYLLRLLQNDAGEDLLGYQEQCFSHNEPCCLFP